MNEYQKYSKDELIKLIEEINHDKESLANQLNDFQQQTTKYSDSELIIKQITELLLNENNGHIINELLTLIREYYDIDRVFTGIFDDTNQLINITHTSIAQSNSLSKLVYFKQLPYESISWWHSKIGRAHV